MKKRYLNDPNFVRSKKSKKKIVYSVIYYLTGTALSLLFILPLLYMLAASTKSEAAVATSNGTFLMFIPDFTNLSVFFDNYAVVFGERYHIWTYAINSLIYCLVVIVLNTLVNGLAGYVLAKFHFPAKGFFSFIIIFLMVVPVETSIIPLLSIVQDLLHLNKGFFSIIAIVIPSIISVFNIFLYTQFFSSIPKEYEEAMHIDGAGRVRMFFNLILPLSKPIVATTAVFTFIGVWNDYVWPSLVVDNRGTSGWPLYPIQYAVNIITSSDGITTGQVMAALVITTLPIFILYVAAQKYIVKGFGTAGLKM